MPTLSQTIKQLDEGFIEKAKVYQDIEAGGPGSGRKPEFGKNTPNKSKLNEMHNNLVSKGWKYDFTKKPFVDDKENTPHVYTRGETQIKYLNENSRGNHSIQ
jgi:hypothetical protein